MTNVKNVISLNSIIAPKIKKQNRIEVNRMTQTLLAYSGDEFEMFLFEWLKYCKKVLDDKSLLYRLGGPGDKGVDIYYKNNKETIYYQAKQYNRQLSKQDIIDISVKIFWYEHLGEVDTPTKIYIISSKGLTNATLKLIKSKEELKKVIIENAEQSLKNYKINYTSVDLTNFIESLKIQDYSKIENIDINDIVLEYYNSDIGSIRFYKQQPFRYTRPLITPPCEEDRFYVQISKLFENHPKKSQALSSAKENYYSCLSLKETDKYLFGNNDEFEIAKKEIFDGVEMLFYNNDSDFDRYIKCLQNVVQIRDCSSLLGENELNIINNSDKKGMCHYLVNEKILNWESHDE